MKTLLLTGASGGIGRQLLAGLSHMAKRRCDELIPIFEKEGVLQKFTLGKAPCLLVDTNKMFEVMVKLYHERGVTMYMPNGN